MVKNIIIKIFNVLNYKSEKANGSGKIRQQLEMALTQIIRIASYKTNVNNIIPGSGGMGSESENESGNESGSSDQEDFINTLPIETNENRMMLQWI